MGEQYYDDVTHLEKIKGTINFGFSLIHIFYNYSKIYRNYFSIIKNVIQKKSNILCIFKNGEKVSVDTFQLINFITEVHDNPEFQLDLKNDLVSFKTLKSISNEEKNIKIYATVKASSP